MRALSDALPTGHRAMANPTLQLHIGCGRATPPVSHSHNWPSGRMQILFFKIGQKSYCLPIKTPKLILTIEWYYRSMYCRSNAMIFFKMANLKAISSSATLRTKLRRTHSGYNATRTGSVQCQCRRGMAMVPAEAAQLAAAIAGLHCCSPPSAGCAACSHICLSQGARGSQDLTRRGECWVIKWMKRQLWCHISQELHWLTTWTFEHELIWINNDNKKNESTCKKLALTRKYCVNLIFQMTF